MRARREALELLGPLALVVAAGVLGTFVSQTTEIYFVTALISVSTVVAIYVFVGNSGVLSFGHISFFAVGVWAAGVLSIPEQEKTGDDAVPLRLPELDDGWERAVAPDRGGGGRRVRAPRRTAAHAPVRARRRHRDVRRARDHQQPPSLLREDRPRPQHLLVGAGDDGRPAGHDRRASRHRRGVRVPAQPAREAAARDPGGSGRRARGRRLDLPAAARRLRALRVPRRVRRRAVHPLHPDQRGRRVPRPDVHHPRDARHRGRDEPLGRGRRRALRERPRLRARGDGGRHDAARE